MFPETLVSTFESIQCHKNNNIVILFVTENLDLTILLVMKRRACYCVNSLRTHDCITSQIKVVNQN